MLQLSHCCRGIGWAKIPGGDGVMTTSVILHLPLMSDDVNVTHFTVLQHVEDKLTVKHMPANHNFSE